MSGGRRRWKSKAVVGAIGALACVATEGCFCCVAADALVSTPSGVRSLGRLRDGDIVTVVDPATGERSCAPIKVLARALRCVGLLRLEDGSTLELTAEHPVWCPEARAWVEAKRWFSGEKTQVVVVDAAGTGLQKVAVVAVEPASRDTTVVDISVQHPAACFVANGVIVHNKSERNNCTDHVCTTSISGTGSEDSGTGSDTESGSDSGTTDS